jgi:cytochrome P450
MEETTTRDIAATVWLRAGARIKVCLTGSDRSTSPIRSSSTRARSEEPVSFSGELGYGVVTRYEDVHAIFRDPATFSSENTQEPYQPRPAAVTRAVEARDFRAYSGVSARQPPEHTRPLGFIKKVFAPRRVETFEAQVRELTVGMNERFEQRRQADLFAELAYALPRW